MFRPPTMLEIPGLDIAGVYRPAGDGTEIGGDFYDVFPTGPTSHAILLGDVSGKGAPAAIVAALVRHVVRAELLRCPSPAAVLAVAHDAVRHAHPEHFCTAVLAHVENAAGGDWRVASAGHHLPLLTDGRSVERIGTTGTILGLLDTIEVEDATFILGRGEALVFYTDGITEARAKDGTFFGEGRLEEAVLNGGSDPALRLGRGLVDAAIGFQDGVTRDDIAVVAVRHP